MKHIFKLFLFFSFFVFLTISCDNDNCNNTCKSWETCKEQATTPVSYDCELKKGNCVTSQDCEGGKLCVTQTHNCEWTCTFPCHDWQICNELDQCEPRPGYCDESTNCGDLKECNAYSNKCEFKCNPECESWQTCNNNKICVAREDDGFCDAYTNCGVNQECDHINHKCVYICNPSCDDWKTCSKSNECNLTPGRCDATDGCTSRTTCNLENHICAPEPTCDPLCFNDWETCKEVDGVKKCVLAPGYCNENIDCPNSVCQSDHSCKNNCEDCKAWEVCVENSCKLKGVACNSDDECSFGKHCENNECIINCNCEYWETCDANTCGEDEESCNNNEDCNAGELCDLDTHNCENSCTPPCHPWEECNSEKSCTNSDNRCSINTDCTDGKICDTVNRRCIYQCTPTCEDWQVCNSTGSCDTENGYCDENSDCGENKECNLSTHLCENQECETGADCVAGFLNRSCNLETGLCETDSGECDPICKPWQECNSSNKCVKKSGYCSSNSECGENQVCTNNHTCKDLVIPGCQNDRDCKEWQFCNENNSCEVKILNCIEDDDCLANQRCQLSTHKCVKACDEVCELWEHCTPDGKKCEANNNSCNDNDNECETDQHCNSNTHECENSCNPNCDSWQECNSQNECMSDSGRCDDISDCDDNQICNGSHRCVYVCVPGCDSWQECNAQGECIKADGYCDATDDCGTTFGFSASCNLNTHLCENDPDFNCDPSCKPWERCQNRACVKIEDRCEGLSDCGANKYCDLNTHTCEDESTDCDPACENKEYCDTTVCKDIPGICNEDNDCSIGENCINNECIDEVCSINCPAWEICDDNTCKIRENRCTQDNECENGICNINNHICEYSSCNCESWEVCNGGICSIADGRCESGDDCRAGELDRSCDLSNHTCITDPGSCDPNCNGWEACNANNECEKQDGYCNSNEDCEKSYSCTDKHICKKLPNGCLTDDNCGWWQVCTDEGICDSDDTHCDSNGECESEDCVKHICELPCNPECQYWQECVEGVCQLDDQYCEENNGVSTCPDEGNCDINHECCPDCEGWQVCDDNQCKTDDDHCDVGGCSQHQTCSNTTHECEEVCTVSCDPSYQKCSNNQCVPDDGRCDVDNPCTNSNDIYLYCDLSTNFCAEQECNKVCETWELCEEDECKNQNGYCTEHDDCSSKNCDFTTHKCGEIQVCEPECRDWEVCKGTTCVPQNGKCNLVSDCPDGKQCNFRTHECTENTTACDPACEDWETCFRPDGVPEDFPSRCRLKDDRCNARYYCGDFSLCNLNNHRCEEIGNCSCPDHKVCLENGSCSLIYGSCESDNDCSYAETCQNNSCVYRSCQNTNDCSNHICDEVCLENSLYGIRALDNHSRRNNLDIITSKDTIDGIVIAVKRDGFRKGAYVASIVSATEEDEGEKIFTDDVLYSAIFVSSNDLSKFTVGNSVKVEGNYVNNYGEAEFAAKTIENFNSACVEASDCGNEENYSCVNNRCVFTKNSYNILNINVANIFLKTPNRAEGFESMLINAVKNLPYTVIEDASNDNGNRIKLRDANNNEFVIAEDLVSSHFDLHRESGQCISKECPEISCDKYCENGFKMYQLEVTGDDLDNDGIAAGDDNCPNIYNPNQTDSDGDEIGDACDSDIDNDGWNNTDDNCPITSNSNQGYTVSCINVAPANATSTYVDSIRTRSHGGGWSTIPSCSWSCDAGYTRSGNSCVEDDPGDKKSTPPIIIPPVRGGAWGDACNHSGDSDKDGVADGDDNCRTKFNPTQEDLDQDGQGDVCDNDIDGDGWTNEQDNAPYTPNPWMCNVCECQNNASQLLRGCSSGNDCESGFSCNSTTRKCEANGCTEDTCPTNTYCDATLGCVQCRNDSECPNGICNLSTKSCLTSCDDDDDCTMTTANGIDTGEGKCHYYQTALRSVKGVLKYDNSVTVKDCNSNSDCRNDNDDIGVCKTLPNGNKRCCSNSSCTAGNGFHSILPRSSSDFVKCKEEECPKEDIDDNWNNGL